MNVFNFIPFACNAKIFATTMLTFLIFFSFSFLSVFLDGLAKAFDVISMSCFRRHVWVPSEVLHWTYKKNYCLYVLKFWVREHGIQCTLEINSNGGFKQGHLKPCSSTTENISITAIFIATKLNRTVTSYEVLRPIHMTLLSRVLAKSRHKLKVLYLPY